jgi:hypothetical protein
MEPTIDYTTWQEFSDHNKKVEELSQFNLLVERVRKLEERVSELGRHSPRVPTKRSPVTVKKYLESYGVQGCLK